MIPGKTVALSHDGTTWGLLRTPDQCTGTALAELVLPTWLTRDEQRELLVGMLEQLDRRELDVLLSAAREQLDTDAPSNVYDLAAARVARGAAR